MQLQQLLQQVRRNMRKRLGRSSKTAKTKLLGVKIMTKTLKRITVAEVETLQKLSIETFSDTFKDQNSAQDLADCFKTA